jgi:hypothetical protein
MKQEKLNEAAVERISQNSSQQERKEKLATLPPTDPSKIRSDKLIIS